MKIIALLLALCLFTACGNSKVIDGKRYTTYGFLNEDEVKAPNVRYRVVAGNLIWTVLLAETIVMPIYFIGFDLFEPVELADCSKYYSTACEER